MSETSEFEQLSIRLKEERRRLHRGLYYYPKLVETLSSLPASGQSLREVLITSGEINDRHGTGLLLSRLFSKNRAFNVHSRSFYGTEGHFASAEIANSGPNDQFASFILGEIAALLQVEHILVVPYMPDDIHTALVLRQATSAPLATWVMDDQAVFSQNLSRALLDDLFAHSDIRFVISPEMKEEYQKVFDFPFFVLPPTVSQELLGSAGQPSEAEIESKSCALIGNVWSARWLTRLESVIESSGWKVNCYGHGAGGTPDRPEFVRKGFVSEVELARGLAAAPFVISPTGTGDDDDDSLHLTRLSLPSRLPYLLAVHKVPILVLGSAESCAARFVTRLGVGLRCGYSRDEFQQATEQLCDQQFNARCRENCRGYAALFGDNGLADWIWKSATAGAPIDSRFAMFDS